MQKQKTTRRTHSPWQATQGDLSTLVDAGDALKELEHAFGALTSQNVKIFETSMKDQADREQVPSQKSEMPAAVEKKLNILQAASDKGQL